jgi:hypothetical protein
MSTNPPRPPVQPLNEGYVVKGGHNAGTSQIQTRPTAPAPIKAQSTARQAPTKKSSDK